jgi:HSP20 family molecular chaperone IbpA
LPAAIDLENIRAEFENGVLRVILAQSAEAQSESHVRNQEMQR